MRYLLPFLPLLYQSLPALAQDGGQPLPLPAMSFENSNLLMKVDEETGKWAESILGGSNFCPHKEKLRRSMLSRNPLEKRDFDEALRNCYVSGVEVLAKSTDFVNHFVGYIMESHIPEIERVLEEGKAVVPNFADETMAAAIPIVLEVFAPHKPAIVEKKHDPFVVLGLASIAIIHLMDRAKLSKGMWELGIRGGMGNTCPAQEIDCGDRLCQGTDGLCNPREFLGRGRTCECKSSECPDPNKNPDATKFFCGNPGCGEATVEGVCEGKEPKYKGCYCANPGQEQPYDMASDHDRFQRIIDGTEPPVNNPTDPGGPPSGNGKTECRRDTISGDYASADEWKFVNREILLGNIDTFCDGLDMSVEDADFVKDFQSPPDGKHDAQFYREWDWNWVVISLGWGKKPELNPEGCKDMIKKIVHGCDWSPEPEDKNPNWYQWKWGGVHTDNHYRAEIIPQTPRARKSVPDERGGNVWWWWDGDESKGYRSRKDANPRVGMNGLIWDLLILHQCLHAIRDYDWRGPHKTTNCAGFVNMSKDAHMFWLYNKEHPAQDLWDETWEIMSYEILKMENPAISGYSNNKRGGGERGWMGVDPYDMPPLLPEDQRTGPLSHGFG